MSEAERATTALIELMARLRDPQRGCPWDLEQTFATIAPYTIEEAYEVADAIEHGDPAKLRDELGDLLFQVVFHARMAEERGWFDFAAVARAIHEKLVRRHPHVFGSSASEPSNATPAELIRVWEEQKARERAEAAAANGRSAEAGVLADVPRGLPALTRAAKLGKRAARVGFDWSDAQGVREKVAEELREVEAAVDAARSSPGPNAAADAADRPSTEAAVAEEIGDVLFAVANWARHLKVDAEVALRAANAKFERRFQAMEARARTRGLALEKLSPAEWDALWREVKADGAAPG
jgi:ATP diphosphatase